MKLKAFTIVEVSLVMFLTTLIISIGYNCYLTVDKYLIDYTKVEVEIYDRLMVHDLLLADVDQSEKIIKKGRGVLLQKGNREIYYSFEEGEITRRINQQEKSIISIPCDGFEFKFNQEDRYLEDQLVDEIRFDVEFGAGSNEFVFYKKYDSGILLEQKKEEIGY